MRIYIKLLEGMMYIEFSKERLKEFIEWYVNDDADSVWQFSGGTTITRSSLQCINLVREV